MHTPQWPPKKIKKSPDYRGNGFACRNDTTGRIDRPAAREPHPSGRTDRNPHPNASLRLTPAAEDWSKIMSGIAEQVASAWSRTSLARNAAPKTRAQAMQMGMADSMNIGGAFLELHRQDDGRPQQKLMEAQICRCGATTWNCGARRPCGSCWAKRPSRSGDPAKPGSRMTAASRTMPGRMTRSFHSSSSPTC